MCIAPAPFYIDVSDFKVFSYVKDLRAQPSPGDSSSTPDASLERRALQSSGVLKHFTSYSWQLLRLLESGLFAGPEIFLKPSRAFL